MLAAALKVASAFLKKITDCSENTVVEEGIAEKIATEKMSVWHVVLWDSSSKSAKLRNKITSPYK